MSKHGVAASAAEISICKIAEQVMSSIGEPQSTTPWTANSLNILQSPLTLINSIIQQALPAHIIKPLQVYEDNAITTILEKAGNIIVGEGMREGTGESLEVVGQGEGKREVRERFSKRGQGRWGLAGAWGGGEVKMREEEEERQHRGRCEKETTAAKEQMAPAEQKGSECTI